MTVKVTKRLATEEIVALCRAAYGISWVIQAETQGTRNTGVK